MPINRRDFIQAAGVLALLPWLGACVEQPALKIAGHKKPSYEVLFMARDFGWFAPSQIQLIDMPSGSAASMQALRSGQVHGAMLGLDEALLLCSEGVELEVVLLFGISIGADVLLMRPDTTDVQHIRGQTLGYDNTVTSKLILHEFLQRYQLDESEIKTIHLAPEQLEEAWHTQQVDALISGAVLASKLMQSGAVAAFGSRQVPDRIFDVLVVTKQTSKSYQSELTQLMQGHFRALHHFRTNPMDASYRIAKRLDMKAEEVLQLYRGLLLPDALANYAYLSHQDMRLVQATQKLIAFMQNSGDLKECYKAESSLSNKFIPRELL